MRRKFYAKFGIVIAALVFCMSFFIGCGLFESGSDKGKDDDTPQTYTIQYTDDFGTHQLTVTAGMPYSLESVPEKTGYTFNGLFDSAEGGTQYVDANGASLSTFDDGKNIVLFPQFSAKEYTIILDYQGASVNGVRQVTATYGSSLPELPKTVTAEHKTFAGWYTQENCGGIKIADAYGLIPIVSVFNDTNFNIHSEYIYLYAGFETEKVTVTCNFGGDANNETVTVDYDTPISQIVPNTRVKGKAPITWSKTSGGEVFNGNITENTTLYAVEYAPVIELDVNGGNKVIPVVARAGSTISLPTPTKDLAKFLYWEDMEGVRYTSTTMPNNSISLKAVWQGKIVFDTNGGTSVDDISDVAGETITLPTPEREGYLFAGWYTTEKEQYTSNKMPATGVKLKAGWYKTKEATITLVENNYKSYDIYMSSNALTEKERKKLDLSSYIGAVGDNGVLIKYEVHYKWGSESSNESAVGTIALYEGSVLSSAYQLYRKNLTHSVGEAYVKDSFEGSSVIHNNVLYLYFGGESSRYVNGYVQFYDVYVVLTYPDTAVLFL